MKNIDIIIPARYSSKRLPGKPLIKIAGQTMLNRMVDIARSAAQSLKNVSIIVATDDERIGKHCEEIDVEWVITPKNCSTGTDRICEAIRKYRPKTNFIINLQGDTPLTPPHYVTAIINEFIKNPDIQVATPITQLTWEALDNLRESKKITPFSGTCVIVNSHKHAIWFSKSIIPSIRNEAIHRHTLALSPVFKHVGIYGYSRNLLEKYAAWKPSPYEKWEGLEQLRLLENGHTIHTVKVENNSRPIIGVDSAEDVIRVEQLLTKSNV